MKEHECCCHRLVIWRDAPFSRCEKGKPLSSPLFFVGEVREVDAAVLAKARTKRAKLFFNPSKPLAALSAAFSLAVTH